MAKYTKAELKKEIERLNDMIGAQVRELNARDYRLRQYEDNTNNYLAKIRQLRDHLSALEQDLRLQSNRIGQLAASLYGTKMQNKEYRRQLKEAIPGWTDQREKTKGLKKLSKQFHTKHG